MTQQYDNTNRGALFPNQDKASDRHPDFKGSINVDGVEYFLDAWQKVARASGSEFLSVSIKRKDKQPGQQAPRQEQRPAPRAPAPAPQRAAPATGFDDMDDDIPF